MNVFLSALLVFFTSRAKLGKIYLGRSSTPLRALFLIQDPVTTFAVVIFPLALAALLPTLSRIWGTSLSGLVPYLPCFINIAWIGYLVIKDPGKFAALYAWGVDLRSQARIRFWSFVVGSTATTLLGLCLALVWGNVTTSDKVFLAISAWSAQVIFFVPRFGCLLFYLVWILCLFLPGLRNLDPHPGPIVALVLALAAVLLLLRAWRSSSDESALKTAAFDPRPITPPAPSALVFRGRGSRKEASPRARPPSPRE